MAFVITEEMRRAREAELAFSPKARAAQFRELADWMRWEQTERFRRLYTVPAGGLLLPVSERRRLRPAPPRRFRPSRPNFLHVLMREAYEKEYRSAELLLKYLGFEIAEVGEPRRPDVRERLYPKARSTSRYEDLVETGALLSALQGQIQVTFEPKGRHREEWWLWPSEEARGWLENRIRSRDREERFQYSKDYDLDSPIWEDGPPLKEVYVPSEDRRTKNYRAVAEEEVWEFLRDDALKRVMPDRRAEIVHYYAMCFEQSREQAEKEISRTPKRGITEDVARGYRISPSTLRVHILKAQTPEVRQLLPGVVRSLEDAETKFERERALKRPHPKNLSKKLRGA